MPPTKCCCCFSLLTGSKIIGFFCTIGTSMYIYGLAMWYQKTSYIVALMNTIYDTPGGGSYALVADYVTALTQNIGNIIIALIAMKAIYLLFSILLLVGLYKKNPKLMMPWLIVEPIRQILFLAWSGFSIWVTVKVFGISTVNANSPLIGIPVAVGISALIFIGVAFYYWRVVKAMRDEMHASLNKIIANDSPYYEDENTVPVVINNSGNPVEEQNAVEPSSAAANATQIL